MGTERLDKLVGHCILDITACCSVIDRCIVVDNTKVREIGEKLVADITALYNNEVFDIEKKMEELYENCKNEGTKLDILMSLHSLAGAFEKAKGQIL